MLTTYKATLHGSQIRWTDDRPWQAARDQDIAVLITMLSDSREPVERALSQGAQMASWLEKIAQTGGIAGIADPVAWQREIRQDRQLIPEELVNVD